MASVRQTHPADEVRTAVAHPVNLDPDSQPLDYTGELNSRTKANGTVANLYTSCG